MQAAANAFCMKSYVNMMTVMIVLMGIAFDVMCAGHYEDSSAHPHDVDVGAIESRQNRSGDHLCDRSESGMPIAEVENPVQGAEQWVDLVRAEQDGDAEFALQRASQFD